MKQYHFNLAQQGKIIGSITWFHDVEQEGRSRLEGDVAALNHLQATIARAVSEKWSGFLPPSQVRVSDPLNWFKEMMVVLEKGGYDIPEMFERYTPTGQIAESAKYAHTNRRY